MNGYDLSTCNSRPQTVGGAAYVEVAMNPCGENRPLGFCGIPDGGNTDVALVPMRDDAVLDPPSDLAVDGLWSLIIFDTPYLIAQQIMIRYRDADGAPTGQRVRQYLNGITRNNNWRFPNWFRPSIRIAEPAVGNLALTGLVFDFEEAPWEVSYLQPTVINELSFNPEATGWRFLRKFRCVSKGRTLHLNAPATATQGRVVSGQIGTESSPKIIAQRTGAEIFQVWPMRFTVSPDFQFNQLPQQDLNCRQDIIKTGSYDMQRHWGTAMNWNEIEDVRPIWRANQLNLQSYWEIARMYTPPVGDTFNTTDFLKYDGFDQNLGWIVTHIGGMSGQATIHMKHRSTWEFVVPGTSPWAAQKVPPCPYDPAALALEKQLAPAIPHSYEARYNDLNILSGIVNKVTRFGRIASSVLGGIQSARGVPRNTVIEDPYHGRNLYGDNGFSGPSNGKGKSRRRR